jgi:tRNA (guanine26-N2/guanine27-N2)-dimethyltransferase
MKSLDRINDIQIADIMAGSGVRSLRFMLELDSDIVIDTLNVNDFSEDFIELFKKNLELNSEELKNMHGNIVNFDNNKLIVTNLDANSMLTESKGFDYIDIDPFGSPNDFLDNSAKRISRGGILAVTGTDTAPLSGTHPNACRRNYWATPLKTGLMHEIGLRIMIRKIQLVGAQYDKALIPIFSYYRDHYNRIFFRCTKGKHVVDDVVKQHKYFLHCKKCFNHNISEYNYHKCVNCGELMEYSGPMWTGKLWDESIVSQINLYANSKDVNINLGLKNADKNFLKTILEESKLDSQGIIGFYDVHEICKYVGKEIQNFDILFEKITSLGYIVSRTHFNKVAIKSNIPASELLKIL